jgi:hypothetical protein
MAVEIKLKGGNILPFREITVYSPKEAETFHTIARGVLALSTEICGRTETYNYIGPVHNLKEVAGGLGLRIVGPIINHDAPVGDKKAVIRRINFQTEKRTVYVSRSGSPPWGSGMFGIWEQVG